MKKQLAVMMCAISFDNQRKILEGIIAGAKERDCNVFVFTNHVSYNEKELNKQGAFKIMELPDFKLFDGVILAKNTIQYQPAADRLLFEIQRSGIPVVSIDDELDGMGHVGISNYNAQKQVVEHIIHEHHKARIAYVTGQISNKDGRERLNAYQDAMMEAGLAVDKKLIYKGTYDVESGWNAVKFFQKQKIQMPEAIICANDNMAIGAMNQLELYGYHVPEDVIVTGFDNDQMAQYYNPAITTVDTGQFTRGYKAVEILFSNQTNQKITVRTEMHIGGSCGCKEKGMSIREVQKNYVDDIQTMRQTADGIKNMITEFSGLEQETELVEALKKYVVQSDMKGFYLCRCKSEAGYGLTKDALDSRLGMKKVNTEYTEKMKVVLAYEKGFFPVYEDIDKGDIIPGKAKESTDNNFFVVVPIFYQNYCYGYCVSVDSYFPLKCELFFSWTLNIGIGLENIRKIQILNRMLNRLNNMWMYDTLTQVYNRAGFFYYAGNLLQKLKKQGEMAELIFADINGLKKVNDTQGHLVGDQFIREIANCFKENLREEQLLMRYGGDEFVVFGKVTDEEEQNDQIKNIRESIERQNGTQKFEFPLSASMGAAVYQASEISNLNVIIEQADHKMYEEKKKNKR